MVDVLQVMLGTHYVAYTPGGSRKKGRKGTMGSLCGGWVRHVWKTPKRKKTKRAAERPPAGPLCGARTQKGTPCRARALPGKSRCKFHGGASTGPKTEAGRAAIAASNRRRARLAAERKGERKGKRKQATP
jgi:hypothetical protein